MGNGKPITLDWLLGGAFLLGVTATWLAAQSKAPLLEARSVVVVVALSIAGGALTAVGLAQVASTGWRVGRSLRTVAMLAAWIVGVRLLVGGSIGPINAIRLPIWLVMLMLAIVETALFSVSAKDRGER